MKADDQGTPESGPGESRPASAEFGLAALPFDSLESVGRRLRSAYGAILREPLPVRLTDLLERIGERERGQADDIGG